MNLHLLPNDLQILIGEYNVEHRPQMRQVCAELLENHKNRDCACMNCGYSGVDEEYTKYILWKKYIFCGAECQYDLESDRRKNYLRAVKSI